ncbi:MAG: diguanylate cyclase [Cyanobacteria bacterium]|nr:diguanylate cyclase [Cyanobacteriota bacterium]
MADDPHINLNPLERLLMRLYRQISGQGVVLLITAISIVLSVLATLVLVVPQLSLEYSEQTALVISLAIAVAVPLCVAPTSAWLIVSLLVRLDQAYLAVLRLSTTDPLTGVANRRGFFTEANTRLNNWPHTEGGLVGMVDLDRFKALNDQFGHQVGDEALCAIANRLQAIVGAGLVGRLGGDEFAFLTTGPHASLEQVRQEIQAHCGSFTLNHRDSDQRIAVSTSIGMVAVHRQESLEQALARADQALYVDKGNASSRERPS